MAKTKECSPSLMNTAHWKEIHYGLGQSLPQLHPGLMHKSETPCRSISKPLLLEESPNHLQTGPSHLKPSLSHSHLGLLHTYNQDASCGSFISLPGIQHESHKQGLEADTTLICNADRALKTIVLYMSFFALGLVNGVMGPTLLELQTIASTTTTKAALLFTWGATGRIPGSLVTAFTFGKCSPLILLAGSVLLIAMCTCLLPWCHQYIVMATIVGLQGFGIGSLGGGCTAYCFRLWQSRAAPFVQALTFTIALGNTCAPLLAQPFLMQSSAETMSSHLNTTPHPYNLGSTPSLDIAMGNITHQEAASKTLDYMTLELRNHSDTVSQVDFHIIGPRSNVTNRPGTGSYREIPRIAPLYLIISSLHLLSTVLYVVLYVKDRIQVEMEVSVKETFSSKVPLSDTKPQSILLCVLFGAFMLCCAGLEVTYGGLLFTYVVEHLAWHESAAAYLNFAYWIFLASGRGLGVVLVRFLTPRCIVIMDLIGACSAMLTLAVFSRYHVLVEWLCSCVLGLSLSTLVATTLNLAYSYLCLSGRLASIFMCCNYAGIMVFPGLTGALFRRVHGHCFVFACLTLAFLMVAIFAIIQVYYIKMRGISRKKTVRSEISADEKSTVIISFEEH